MVFQKSEIIFYKLIGKDWQLLEQKYKLEDDFQELINFAEDKGCSDRDFLNDLHTISVLELNKKIVTKTINTRKAILSIVSRY